MLDSVVYVKNHCHLWKEAGDAKRREIRFGVKNEPVSSVRNWTIDKEERLHPAVGIGPCMAQLGPTLVSVLHFERDGDATRWSSS